MAKKYQMRIHIPHKVNQDKLRGSHTGWDDPQHTLQKPRTLFTKQNDNQTMHRNDYFDFQQFLQNSTWRVAVTIGAAICIGLLMGFTVLSIFSHLSEQKSQSPFETRSGNDVFEQSEAEESQVWEPKEHSYFAIQVGAFEALEQAEVLRTDIEQVGLPQILVEDDGVHRLYVGIGLHEENVLKMGQDIQKQGLETYIREHTLSSESQPTWYDLPEAASIHSFLKAGEDMFVRLIHISTQGISDIQPILQDEEWTSLQKEHYQFLEQGEQLLQVWPEQEKHIGQQMMHEVTSSMYALQTYREQNHSAYLWKVQQYMLNYRQHIEELWTK